MAVWALNQQAGLAEVWALAMAGLGGLTQSMFIALFFSVILLYFLVTRSRVIHVSHALQAARIKNLAHEKHMAETRLHLLQAQIEPHFLFNTLSHVLSLVDTDPAQGKKMLARLTRYLRSSLKRSREHDATLRQEIELIRDYLGIFKVRMSERLSYRIDVPEDCLEQRFMPMLLQPLVENAIQHGLEPAPEWTRLVQQLAQGLPDRPVTGYLSWLRASRLDATYLIPVEEVCYFKSEDKYTTVVTRDDKFLIRKSVSALEAELDPEKFWRIHRGLIVNLASIAVARKTLNGGCTLQLKDRDEVLSVSRQYAHRFRQM